MNWIELILGLFIGLYLKSLIDSLLMKIGMKIIYDKGTTEEEKKSFQGRVEEMKEAQKRKTV